jgi:hypothetical protein
MSSASNIFISYNRSDGAADAGRLADWLEQKFGKERVFIDVADIDLGANWERVVEHNLNNAIAVLVVVGPVWKITEPLELELRVALDAGVSIVPILVRGAEWSVAMRELPPKLLPIRKLNAMHLDHGSWTRDITPLMALLERMMKDPDRARVICSPPNPISVLQTGVNIENVRSLLAEAADLAECLDDPAVLSEAQTLLPTGASETGNHKLKAILPYLADLIKTARYRLLIEQIGRDFCKCCSGESVSQYLGDSGLEQKIRLNREFFEEEKREWSRTKGDSGNPGQSFRELSQEDEQAKVILRKKLPGITKDMKERERLFEFIRSRIQHALNDEEISQLSDYVILKQFTSYHDMAIQFRDENKRIIALGMLKRYNKTHQLY